MANAQHGANSLSSCFFARDNCRFLKEKELKMTKAQKFLIYKVSTEFLSNFRETPWTGMLKTLNKVGIRCPVFFNDGMFSVFWKKMC